MHPVESFLEALDRSWPASDRRLRLQVFGSAALFPQTSYVRGTKDVDVLRSTGIEAERERLLTLAGKGSKLAAEREIYLEIVGSEVPFLPRDATWIPHDLGLDHFDIVLLSVADVVVTKLKRFHGDDKADVRAMVDGGYVEHAQIVNGVRDVVERLKFDARSDQLPRFVRNLNTVERDYFGVAETFIELPEER